MLDDGERLEATRQKAVTNSKMPGKRQAIEMKKPDARISLRNAATKQQTKRMIMAR
jgi:hypothetical protein